jgi:hypothetical protein
MNTEKEIENKEKQGFKKKKYPCRKNVVEKWGSECDGCVK